MSIRWKPAATGVAAGTLIVAAVIAPAGCGPSRPSAASTSPLTVSVTTPGTGDAFVSLPAVTGSGIRALWQGAPWDDLTFTGGTLLGVTGKQVAAVSAATGRPLWTATMPASLPDILGLVPAGSVDIVAAGHTVGQSPSAVYPIVSEYVALDAATGAMRWAVPVGGNYQSPPIAASGSYLLTGDRSGAVTARIAATGRVAWRARRPRGCGPPSADQTDNAGLGLAADGALLTASFECGSSVIVQRLDPATGKAAWTWRSPAASGPQLSVAAAALDGGLVLVAGEVSPSARPFAGSLPRPHAWPPALGPADDAYLIIALSAADGRPRWSETGGQLETFVPDAGTLCEVVTVGLECRDDATGDATMRTLLTGKGATDSPPYYGDGYAGVSGGFAAVTVPSRHGVALRVVRVRGGATVALVRLAIGTTAYGGSDYQVFVVAAGTVRGLAAPVFLLRRVDLPGYPVLALDIPAPA